jgi:hypothetical protein
MVSTSSDKFYIKISDVANAAQTRVLYDSYNKFLNNAWQKLVLNTNIPRSLELGAEY